jgi:hypothetical protein
MRTYAAVVRLTEVFAVHSAVGETSIASQTYLLYHARFTDERTQVAEQDQMA